MEKCNRLRGTLGILVKTFFFFLQKQHKILSAFRSQIAFLMRIILSLLICVETGECEKCLTFLLNS